MVCIMSLPGLEGRGKGGGKRKEERSGSPNLASADDRVTTSSEASPRPQYKLGPLRRGRAGKVLIAGEDPGGHARWYR